MKMTMTNAEAIQHLNGLRELERLNNPVPAVAGYRIVQNIHALIAALAPYNEVREKTVRKYAKDGKSVNRDTDPEAFSACTKELHEIEQLTISVEVNTVPLNMFAEGKFPISAIFALSFMVGESTAKEV